jgi:hypothetical protein
VLGGGGDVLSAGSETAGVMGYAADAEGGGRAERLRVRGISEGGFGGVESGGLQGDVLTGRRGGMWSLFLLGRGI